MQNECKGYVSSQKFNSNLESVNGVRNLDLENQIQFCDSLFDIVSALDVLEHVFQPQKVLQEISRTLKPLGVAILTFPIWKEQVEAITPRIQLSSNGSIELIKDPIFHGNPISDEGSLVTYDYGYEIHKELNFWTDMDTEIVRFQSKRLGILGEFTEVIILSKNL